MGIVRSQSIVGSFWVYLGAALGFVTTAILFPQFLDPDQIGMLNMLVTYSILFAQFAAAGFVNTITRMFPYFRDDTHQHHGFLFFTLCVITLTSLVMCGVYYAVEPLIAENSSGDMNILKEYMRLIIPLFIFTVFFNILDAYTKALFNATRGILLKEVVLRVLTLCSITLYIFNIVTFHQFVYLYVASYGIILLCIVAGLIRDGQFSLRPDFSLFDKQMVREVLLVSFYGVVITSANIIVINLDRLMIEKLVIENPLAQVGIYTTCSYFATLVILPNRPLQKITSTLVAESWKKGDVQQLQTLYTKSTVTQLIVGTLIFFGLCINIDYIFQILPDYFSAGKWVIIFIGIMNLTDMAAGVNKDIVSNSTYYRKLSHWTVGLVVLIIILNSIFIPRWGITGAAVSSCIARIIYNIVAFHFVYKKFKLQPYSVTHIIILVMGIIAYGIAYVLPETQSLILNILYKSMLLTVTYSLCIMYFHVSEDVDGLVRSIKDTLMRARNK